MIYFTPLVKNYLHEFAPNHIIKTPGKWWCS